MALPLIHKCSHKLESHFEEARMPAASSMLGSTLQEAEHLDIRRGSHWIVGVRDGWQANGTTNGKAAKDAGQGRKQRAAA